MTHDNHEISFTRRRYGKRTFTWIHVLIGGEWQESGDPIQKIQPSRKDIGEAIEIARKHRSLSRKGEPQII